jgi:TonB family protein
MKTRNWLPKAGKLLPAMVITFVLISTFILPSCSDNAKSIDSQTEIASPQTSNPSPVSLFTQVNTTDGNEIFVMVEKMPSFPGGDAGLMEFINSNIQYPEVARVNGIQGSVFVMFYITSNGKVENVKILKGADPALDAEALRVVSMLPDWTPGSQDGKNVNVWIQLPITFQLK